MYIRTLKNCDTCRKAVHWLRKNGIDAEIADIRETPMSVEEIENYIAMAGWEKLLNRRSTTWRNLSEVNKADINEAKAIELIAEHPTLMKRPVFVIGENIIVGFDNEAREALEANYSGR